MPDESPSIERELQMLEAELRRLEAGTTCKLGGSPAASTMGNAQARRRHAEARGPDAHPELRPQVQVQYVAVAIHVVRGPVGSRAAVTEEGRPGPFAAPRPVEEKPAKAVATERAAHVATFKEPLKEMDKLHQLCDQLAEMRRQTGQDAIPFHKFADLVNTQVTKMKEKGSPEVAFRVTMKDGKVAFTAR